jgi:hypothetical protein
VKTHYNDLLWGVTLYYFSKVCIFEYISYFKFLKTFHNIFAYYVRIYPKEDIKKVNYFISFYKGEDWNIFAKKNPMYLCTQKHKYIPKII